MAQVPIGKGGMGFFSLPMLDFYFRKSVLPKWKFLVEFVPNVKQKDLNVLHYLNKMRYHHIVDVSLPFYKWTTEETMYGPIAKKFPKVDHHGFTVKLTMEDDKSAQVLALIHALQRTIVRENGYYKRLPEVIVGDIIIHLYNHFGTEVCYWIANNTYFLGADDITLSYKDTDAMSYGVTFGCDTIRFRKNTITVI